jgi:trimeric autotransporter adhesin
MKSIRTSSIGRSYRSLAINIAGLFLAFAFAPLPTHAQIGNTATGTDALLSNTTGSYNTADGYAALNGNTTGSHNTAVGFYALVANKTGDSNTANGDHTLFNNTAIRNTANGASALYSNTTGEYNTADGAYALYFNTTGHWNTANGGQALYSNTTGAYNTATGFQALQSATGDSAADNTATGALALQATTSGFYNTATGVSALYSNTTGYYNVASGVSALTYNLVGHDNTAEGFQALLNAKGSNNIGIGSNAGANLTTGSNNIDIGNLGVAGDAAKIRIGKQGTQTATYVAGIYGKTVASGTKVAVMIDSTGKLGTVVSSARYKEQIKSIGKNSEAILKLEPVTFRYKHELDPDGVTQFGLIAEQVEKVNPDLVVYGEDGKVNTVRYEAVNAMLLNEFLKEHRNVQELKATVAEQAAMIARQQKQIEAIMAAVQRASDKLSEPGNRVAKN